MVGLSPNIRVYRYLPGHFFSAHCTLLVPFYRVSPYRCLTCSACTTTLAAFPPTSFSGYPYLSVCQSVSLSACLILFAFVSCHLGTCARGLAISSVSSEYRPAGPHLVSLHCRVTTQYALRLIMRPPPSQKKHQHDGPHWMTGQGPRSVCSYVAVRCLNPLQRT